MTKFGKKKLNKILDGKLKPLETELLFTFPPIFLFCFCLWRQLILG